MWIIFGASEPVGVASTDILLAGRALTSNVPRDANIGGVFGEASGIEGGLTFWGLLLMSGRGFVRESMSGKDVTIGAVTRGGNAVWMRGEAMGAKLRDGDVDVSVEGAKGDAGLEVEVLAVDTAGTGAEDFVV